MSHKEWPDLLPVVQSVLNNAPSPQRGDVAPIASFTGRKPSAPVKTFLRRSSSSPVTITDVQLKLAINTEELQKFCEDIHPVVQTTLEDNSSEARRSASRGKCPNFTQGDYVLVSRS